MTEHFGEFAWWLCAAVQIVGLSSALLTRLDAATHHRGAWLQNCSQGLFLFSLAAVGAATMLALVANDGGWVLPGATLGVMIIAAVCDFQHGQPAPVHAEH